MRSCEPEDLGIKETNSSEDGTINCFELPRQGKDIKITKWIFKDNELVKKGTQTLKWKGRKFSY